MEGKAAILFSGSAYSIRFSLPSIMKNLVEENDADVFIVTTRGSKRRKTFHTDYIPEAHENEAWNKKNKDTIVDHTEMSDEELQLLRDTFGDRLKVLFVAEDNPEYFNFLQNERQKFMDSSNKYIKEGKNLNIPQPFHGRPINTSDEGTVRCIIDQYNHIKKTYELMEQYEKQTGKKYDYVMRARIDFITPFKFNMEHYLLNHDEQYLYVCGSVRRDPFEWSDEFCWFSRRNMASKLFPNLNKMGFILDRKYNTIQYNTPYAKQGNDFKLDPECQFSLLLHELNINPVNVRIYRSTKYSDGQDGFDYFNYMFRRDAPIDVNYEYELVTKYPTDINEHNPVLYEYASKCNHVTELGLRYGNSTIAFLKAVKDNNSIFHSYDPQSNSRMDYIQQIADENNIDYKYFLSTAMNNEETESLIEETDMLFIDTNHHNIQMEKELRLHSPKVRKYIAIHDTVSFWNKGQGFDNGGGGMKLAIEPFIENKKDFWKVVEDRKNNNGLMILERIKQEENGLQTA